ncbi:class I SAM-dependent methyltransferase [Actinomadura madurae]|uniref:class I SAM-dependent methyltransferase n=1 Tax=Actinomadura madurae TaxID=1993 RepID=UPI0020D23114|nr:methyltransferase domain-containing protein [Actinomadura madurae]MCP9983275.1 methyltransferase domain-containing protein [Actinomadura madurae]
MHSVPSARSSEPTIASLRETSEGGPGDSLAHYWTFYRAVAEAQLIRWLPRRPSRVLDVSGGHGLSAAQAAAAGHAVLEIRDPERPGRPSPARPAHGERTTPLIGDSGTLPYLADASLDAVIAENRALSRHLATETTIAEIARVLRPGGRVLLCVDSLTLGMALLAERNYWAHLSDVPSAEVVLVPWPDGTITRSFSSHQLRELLADAGLEVEWIRPPHRALPSTVEHVLTESPEPSPASSAQNSAPNNPTNPWASTSWRALCCPRGSCVDPGGRPPGTPVTTRSILTPRCRCAVTVRACDVPLRSPGSTGMRPPLAALAPRTCP